MIASCFSESPHGGSGLARRLHAFGFRNGARILVHTLRRGVLAAALICGLGGCTAVVMGMGSEGADIEAVRTGMSRAEIDAVLGSPLFAKGSRSTRYTATYAVDHGRPPSAGRAALGGLIDLMTFGVVAPMMDTGQPMEERPHLIVVYDGDGRAIGLFDAGGSIPADGRSTERPAALRKTPPTARKDE
jgi:Fe2+ transport system protein FeoA